MKEYFSRLRKFWRNKFENEKISRRDISRFFSKIEIEKEERVKGIEPCWIFKSSCNNSGYSRILFLGKIKTSHRISFRLFRGKIPKGLLVCHKCDFRRCCNPKHLFLGTHKENTRDMIKKGRQLDPKELYKIMKGKVNLGDLNGLRKHPERSAKGSNVASSKINEETVLEIRKLYATGEYLQKDLARKFNLFKGNIQKIITRKTWRHI